MLLACMLQEVMVQVTVVHEDNPTWTFIVAADGGECHELWSAQRGTALSAQLHTHALAVQLLSC